MTKEEKDFIKYIITLLILWGFINEGWRSIELSRFHTANNLQTEYNKATEAKLKQLTNILEIAIDTE